jgi:hypothetical protein
MHEHERVKLIAGPYQMPRCRIGGKLRREVRGKVKVRGISDGLIPWPFTWIREDDHRPALILCGDLARAVRTESAAAIQHHWGVSEYYTRIWCRALGVEPVNDGTSALLSRLSPDSLGTPLAKKRQARTLKSPERAAKISAALRGRSRPKHVIEAVRRKLTGRKVSAEARANMSKAQRERGTWPPAAGPAWTASEDALLGAMRDCDVAKRTRRSLSAVRGRRHILGIGPYAKRYRDRQRG